MTLRHRRKKRGGYNTSSPISFHCTIFFIYSLTRKGHFFRHDIRRIFLVKWTGWRIIHRGMLYKDCLYRRILKFFKQADECCYFSIVFFYKLANPLCLWISDTETVWFICIFSVFIDQKCCVNTWMYRRFTSASMRDTCIWTLM